MIEILLLIIIVLLGVIAFGKEWLLASIHIGVLISILAVTGLLIWISVETVIAPMLTLAAVIIFAFAIIKLITDLLNNTFKPNFDHLFDDEEKDEK